MKGVNRTYKQIAMAKKQPNNKNIPIEYTVKAHLFLYFPPNIPQTELMQVKIPKPIIVQTYAKYSVWLSKSSTCIKVLFYIIFFLYL